MVVLFGDFGCHHGRCRRLNSIHRTAPILVLSVPVSFIKTTYLMTTFLRDTFYTILPTLLSTTRIAHPSFLHRENTKTGRNQFRASKFRPWAIRGTRTFHCVSLLYSLAKYNWKFRAYFNSHKYAPRPVSRCWPHHWFFFRQIFWDFYTQINHVNYENRSVLHLLACIIIQFKELYKSLPFI